MATVTSETLLEVITEAPKYNPTSRTLLDPQNEHEEIEGEKEEPKKRQNEDECCNRCCYDSTYPCDDWLTICLCSAEETAEGCCSGNADCCFCDDCGGCCDDCGDCCDDCDGCDCSD